MHHLVSRALGPGKKVCGGRWFPLWGFGANISLSSCAAAKWAEVGGKGGGAWVNVGMEWKPRIAHSVAIEISTGWAGSIAPRAWRALLISRALEELGTPDMAGKVEGTDLKRRSLAQPGRRVAHAYRGGTR